MTINVPIQVMLWALFGSIRQSQFDERAANASLLWHSPSLVEHLTV
jgi:hypothetical protein